MQKLTISCLIILVFVVVNAEEYGSSRLKQCIIGEMSGKDTGPLWSCLFEKVQTESALRVTFHGGLRASGHGGCSTGCCRRWFITINGNEHTSPAPIEVEIYTNANVDIHRPGTLDGFVEYVPRGLVNVGISVGQCNSKDHRSGNAFTGWDYPSRLIIEEVPPLQEDSF